MPRGGGWQITPRRTSTGWLGITRSSGVSGNASTRTSVGTPASTETTAGARPRSSPAPSHPRAIAPAMFPALTNRFLIAGRLVASGLVEKALLDQASLLLGRDLD